MLLTLAMAALAAVNVETALLGPATGINPQLVTADGQGNLILAGTVPCSILQECQPISLVKLDPTGRVIFRRGVGDSSWRFQPTLITADREGNIIIAGSTADPNLPTVRPFQPRLAGANDAYVLQLSPDGARITFATYFGGSGAETLVAARPDEAGNIIAVIATSSADFPFTVADSPAPSGPAPRFAAVRLSPSAGRMAFYAVDLGRSITNPTIDVSSDGTAIFPQLDTTAPPGAVRLFALEIQPDGTRRRRPLPLPNEALALRTARTADGSLWIAGQAVAGGVPATPNAWQQASPVQSYVRMEGRLALTPPGLMDGTIARMLAVDTVDDNVVYAGTNRGLARTNDNGWTWEVVAGAAAFRSLNALGVGGGRVWAVTVTSPNPVLQYSDDGGATWTATTFPIGTPSGPLLLAALPADRNALFLSAGNTLYRTNNSGETWTSRQFPGATITAIAADSRGVALSTVPSGSASVPPRPALLLSADGGESFAESLPLNSLAQTLRFDPNEPGTLYVTDLPRLIRTNTASFPRVEEMPMQAAPFTQFGLQRGLPGVILALGFDGALYRSQDAGRTFQPLTLPNPGRPFGPVAMQFVVAAGGVAHATFNLQQEPFLARVGADDQLTYLTYLGVRTLQTIGGLHALPNGGVIMTGQMDGSASFPGEILRGTTSLFPPGFVAPTTSADIFAVSFAPNGELNYAAALAGVAPDTLSWSGLGPGGNLLLFGITSSPDFPGLNTTAPFPAALFLSRLRP